MNVILLAALLVSFAALLVAERTQSLSLRGNAFRETTGSNHEVFADPPDSNYFTTGWWYGEVTASKTCDIDDDGGDNQVVSFEGYALNTCIFQGGEYIKYQCDGIDILYETYSDAGCDTYVNYFPVRSVGCADNVVYNCSSDDTTLPVPAGEQFVTQLYYAPSFTQPNCTGQIQYFVGEENQHCFEAQAGTSQYNDYPDLRVYSDSTECKGDFVTNTDLSQCTEEVSETGISYTHFNTTLLTGPPRRPHDSGDDDFFDDEGALIGVIVGGAVALCLALGVAYYFLTKPGEKLLGST